MKKYSGMIFGGVMGMILSICGLDFMQWQFYAILITSSLMFACMPRPWSS